MLKGQPVLEIKNVTKTFNTSDNKILTACNDISLEFEEGKILGIVGESGCGKSTLLKCINRLENINDGKIKFKGIDISEISMVELRQKIGMVFQDYNLFEHLTVLDNLIIGLIKIKKYSRDESIHKALNMLKNVDLIDKKDKYPNELSGGQKQRVAIARTLLMKPDIILLDEPTSALDKEMKDSVLNLIKKIVEEDMTLIIVSHEEEFIKNVSDQIYVLKNNCIEVK